MVEFGVFYFLKRLHNNLLYFWTNIIALRTTVVKDISAIPNFTNQLLYWANQFREVVLLDSNAYHQKYSTYDAVLAVDALTSLQTDYNNAFQDLQQYQSQTKDWLFGYFSYDLKNDIDELEYKTQKSKMLLRDYLCESRAGNTCFLLTITDFSNNYQLAFYSD